VLGFSRFALLDGIRMDDASWGSTLNFTGLTSAGLERVEVLRGSYGLLYGSAAIGGVIGMETRRVRYEDVASRDCRFRKPDSGVGSRCGDR
jgi:outer membrane cobalamin receptor